MGPYAPLLVSSASTDIRWKISFEWPLKRARTHEEVVHVNITRVAGLYVTAAKGTLLLNYMLSPLFGRNVLPGTWIWPWYWPNPASAVAAMVS